LVALFFARIDLENGEILYCNAGLPSPLIFARDNDVTRLDEGGPMLGAMANGIFHTGIAALHPGHTLIACSDGVTECQNSRDEEFELVRLSAAARAGGGGSASQTLFSALGAVLDFAAGCPLGDDLTLLVVRREQIGTRNSSTVMREQVPVALSGGVRRQRLVS
jgi:sigma-B regulation protein RsbU (phosphoserine phosphatase)